MRSDPINAKSRPIVDVQLSKKDNPLSVFMHTTLRPVLKQKHDTLCAIIRDNKNLNTDDFSAENELRNTATLKQFMQKNTELRSVLIGTIIGSFTTEELEFYLQNQKEAKRRIVEMIITRFLSEFKNH
ncbi:MAG: hypothetical protein ACI8ZM_004339 [Crocinitomix sp.]|jgi:hypothetical protein